MLKITTTSQLRSELRILAAIEAGKELGKVKEPQIKAAIALYAPTLTDAERATEHSKVVSQIAAELGLEAHESKRVHPAFGFKPQCFSERSAAGVAGNKAIERATYPLRFKDAAKAKEYAARLLTPKVETVASSADKISRVVRAYAKLTTAQKRRFMEEIKSL